MLVLRIYLYHVLIFFYAKTSTAMTGFHEDFIHVDELTLNKEINTVDEWKTIHFIILPRSGFLNGRLSTWLSVANDLKHNFLDGDSVSET